MSYMELRNCEITEFLKFKLRILTHQIHTVLCKKTYVMTIIFDVIFAQIITIVIIHVKIPTTIAVCHAEVDINIGH